MIQTFYWLIKINNKYVLGIFPLKKKGIFSTKKEEERMY